MKNLLTKIGLPKAIGLHIDGELISVSQVVTTPLGPVKVYGHSETIPQENHAEALPRILKPLVGSSRFGKTPVAVGIPSKRIFFSTRPVQTAVADLPRHVLLREALRSTNIDVDDMTVDVIKFHPDRRDVAGIVACDNDYVTELLNGLTACGVRPVRVEPAPCALLRSAAVRHRAPRLAKAVTRLFLNEKHGLAVLSVGGNPIIWRSINLQRGDEASAIISVFRSLGTLTRPCGIELPLETVMVHGRMDLMRLLDMEWVREQIGARVDWFEGPTLDDSEVAFGLACGCLNDQTTAFDLARSAKSPASFIEMVPFRGLAIQAAMLLVMLFILFTHSDQVATAYTAMQHRNAARSSLQSVNEQQLAKEKEALKQRVAATHKFVNGRIVWTTLTRELTTSLPPNVVLTAVQGVNELPSTGKRKGKQKKPKKSLVLQGTVLIDTDGSMPYEIDHLLDTLRTHPVLTKDFPVVELAELKHVQGETAESATAVFTILCLPKDAKKNR